MLTVGLTGGIGSGKSTVAYLFSLLNIPVYYADQRAKELMVEEEELKIKIKDLFGEKAYLDDGSVNRKWLASRVFSDAELLHQLNALVHPAVGRDVKRWFDEQGDVPYAIEEAALLVETGSYRNLDRLIVVKAPKNIRVDRVCKRDGVEAKQVEERMAHQASEEELSQVADFEINNDGKHLLVPQVVSIDKALRTANALPLL